jgi:hypothetical protein
VALPQEDVNQARRVRINERGNDGRLRALDVHLEDHKVGAREAGGEPPGEFTTGTVIFCPMGRPLAVELMPPSSTSSGIPYTAISPSWAPAAAGTKV